jgi:hypothetical protein
MAIAGGARALAASLCACALVAAGCGGDDEPAATPEPLTGATGASGLAGATDFLGEADEICAEANTALANLPDGLDSSTQATQKLGITEGLVDSIESLGTPETNTEDLDRFLKAMGRAVSALERQQLAANRDDQAGVDEAEASYQEALGDAKRAAEAFGFEECGQKGKAIESGSGDGIVGGIDDGTTVPPVAGPPAPAAPPATTPPPVITPPPEETPPVAPPPDDDSGGVTPEGDTGGITPG